MTLQNVEGMQPLLWLHLCKHFALPLFQTEAIFLCIYKWSNRLFFWLSPVCSDLSQTVFGTIFFEIMHIGAFESSQDALESSWDEEVCILEGPAPAMQTSYHQPLAAAVPTPLKGFLRAPHAKNWVKLGQTDQMFKPKKAFTLHIAFHGLYTCMICLSLVNNTVYCWTTVGSKMMRTNS